MAEQLTVAARELEREVVQEEADDDRRQGVRDGGAGHAVQNERHQSERRSQDVDRVPQVDGHDRRIRALAEQRTDGHAARGSLAAQLATNIPIAASSAQ